MTTLQAQLVVWQRIADQMTARAERSEAALAAVQRILDRTEEGAQAAAISSLPESRLADSDECAATAVDDAMLAEIELALAQPHAYPDAPTWRWLRALVARCRSIQQETT